MNAIVPVQARSAPTTAPAAQAADQRQYLTFLLGGEAFALCILRIKEIIEYQPLTEVPMMPACIRGVINLRGAVVPVLDLAARFGKRPSPVTKRSCIVIIEAPGDDASRQDIGVVVDAVSAVLEIPAGDIEPTPAFGTHIRSDFIEGIGKVNGKFVILLSIGSVLSQDELGALERVPRNDGVSGP